jgi:type IV pilus biogenesis protein PilP
MYARKLLCGVSMLGVVMMAGPDATRAQEMPALVGSAAQEIARINERIAILSAQLAEVELQSKIATKQAEIAKLAAPSGGDMATGATGAAGDMSSLNPDDLAEEARPLVREISGVDGELYATLLIGDGMVRSVKVGDKVDGWSIDKITINEVWAKSHGEKMKLSFVRDMANHPWGKVQPVSAKLNGPAGYEFGGFPNTGIPGQGPSVLQPQIQTPPNLTYPSAPESQPGPSIQPPAPPPRTR